MMMRSLPAKREGQLAHRNLHSLLLFGGQQGGEVSSFENMTWKCQSGIRNQEWLCRPSRSSRKAVLFRIPIFRTKFVCQLDRARKHAHYG
eukprot:scaffold1933_cov165-Amphora_coffeaeformis.AAC.12